MPKRLTSKDKVLDGAADLARRYGLPSISIRGVADVCGVSTGTIYTYFPSRDELVASTAEKLFAEAFYEGFCHPNPDEGYLAYCERLYRSLSERLSSTGADWLGQLQGLDPGAREAGRRRMERLLSHMLEGLESVFANDPHICRDGLVGDLSAERICRLTLTGMFDAIRRGDPDCSTMLALLGRSLYR